ncbi:MAG TPA: RNase adapter RapZ [Halanaerobiales bacterium]|nr:RNase adapter RapZ [Halanaerobiales bacterium]
MEFLIVTGMSGAGKSVALDVLEDMGFFCIDNLPPAFINKFAELCLHSELNKIAVVIDIRGREFFNVLFDELAVLEKKGFNYEILYLEASDETLIRRYKETRRKHPLNEEGRVLDAILKERQLLEEIRGRANKVIDTSPLSRREFNEELKRLYSSHVIDKQSISISIISFGYKYGIPLDADMVFDVRFLPNPHYVNSLKDYTGKDANVQEYIFKWPLTEKFFSKFFDFIDFLLPEYKKEGKSHLMLAIGCTGGQHRSVTTAIKLKEHLLKKGYRVMVEHKDINK